MQYIHTCYKTLLHVWVHTFDFFFTHKNVIYTNNLRFIETIISEHPVFN